MAYKLLYIVAEEVSLKTKGLSGTLDLYDDHASISGPENMLLPYADFEHLRIFRLYKVGTIIHLRCAEHSVFLSVPRFNLFGMFAVINYFKTRALFGELQQRVNLEAP